VFHRSGAPDCPIGTLQADRTGIAITESFDTGVFFAKSDTARQQYNWSSEPHAAEINRQLVFVIIAQCLI